MAVFSRPRPFMENPNRQKMIQRPTTTPARQGDSFLLPLRPLERVPLRSVPSLHNHGARFLPPSPPFAQGGPASPHPPSRPPPPIHPPNKAPVQIQPSGSGSPRPAPIRAISFDFSSVFWPDFFCGFSLVFDRSARVWAREGRRIPGPSSPGAGVIYLRGKGTGPKRWRRRR
jgi:hypothetical protein